MKELFHEFGHGSLSRLPIHCNPGLEIVYLRHGHLLWQCDGKPEAVRPDSLFFTLPWQEHGSVREFEPGHYWYFVVIRLKDAGPPLGFPKALGFDASTAATVNQLLIEASHHSWTATPIIRVLLPALVEELEHPGLFHELRVIQMTAQLVLELARILHTQENAAKLGDVARFSRLLVELAKTCTEPWTLEQMAARLKLRRTRFGELFHHYTGDTPLHYLSRLRIERARYLLRTTRRSVTEIALDCGFSSSQHFARVFHEFTGDTASAYRKIGPPPIQLPRSHGECD
jgi:AraC family L-rhamnose operon regulatory protein RhaS